MTADILAKIDGALTDYGYIDHGEVGSSMRWRPEPPEPEDGHDGECGPIPDEARGSHVITLHFKVPRMGWNVHICAEARSADAVPRMTRNMKAMYGKRRGWYPRPVSHCEECNPRGNPGPLAVNGSEYQRRLRNRRKRGR
jgi:hypothetical protein